MAMPPPAPPPTNKKVDPGWNDPPTLTYSASNPPPKSRITNKRVAFPLLSNQSPPTTNQVFPTTTEDKSDNFNNEDALKHVLANIELILTNNDPGAAIKEKIDVLKSTWNEDKLSNKIKKNVVDMSKYILDGNSKSANECQLQIMMENPMVCEPWMGIFRQLISNEHVKK